MQRFAHDLGAISLGTPEWGCACCDGIAAWLPRLELIFLDFGLLGSLYVGYRIAATNTQDAICAVKCFIPWAAMVVALFATGVWIVHQPMQMRGVITMEPIASTAESSIPAANH